MGQLGMTTPFGRRPASLGQVMAAMHLDAELEERRNNPGNHPAAVDKWRLFRTLTQVRETLDLSDRTLSLLQALLTFHPETALTLPAPHQEQDDQTPSPSTELVVFPSNRQLAMRANGMAEKTIRRHLAALVDAGLILRRDSANGKRYARRAEDDAERFAQAYGFDLTPLVLRAHEFEHLAEELKREERRRSILKERISIRRRDIAKLLALAFEENMPGGWESFRLRFLDLVTPLRRLRETPALEAVAEALMGLAAEVQGALEQPLEAKNMTGNDGIFDRHISNSNTDAHSDFEPASEKAWSEVSAVSSEVETATIDHKAPETFPVGLIREACLDMAEYADSPGLHTWPQVIAAARVIRPMLGISPDAWSDTVKVLGEQQAAAAVGLILQRSEFSSEAETHETADGRKLTAVNSSPAVRSPGGYLRALTEKARAGDFSLGPVLMATIGQRLKVKRARRAS